MRGTWTKIPNWVLEVGRGLSPVQALALIYVAARANYRNPNLEPLELAAAMGVDPRTAKRALRALHEAGLVEARDGAYRLASAPVSDAHGTRTGCARGVHGVRMPCTPHVSQSPENAVQDANLVHGRKEGRRKEGKKEENTPSSPFYSPSSPETAGGLSDAKAAAEGDSSGGEEGAKLERSVTGCSHRPEEKVPPAPARDKNHMLTPSRLAFAPPPEHPRRSDMVRALRDVGLWERLCGALRPVARSDRAWWAWLDQLAEHYDRLGADAFAAAVRDGLDRLARMPDARYPFAVIWKALERTRPPAPPPEDRARVGDTIRFFGELRRVVRLLGDGYLELDNGSVAHVDDLEQLARVAKVR